MARKTAIAIFVFLAIISAASGFIGPGLAQGFLHPMRRLISPALVNRADAVFEAAGAAREDFTVAAPDGIILRGWKVRPRAPNGDWVMLFHGVSDNRLGLLSYADFLLENGYSLVMMDARAHGESGGTMATYGWKERYDTRAIADALFASEKVGHLLALGESMGAAIALQSAGIDPRFSGVVAEAPFRDVREEAYDYAGMEKSAWLGKTLFRPAVIFGMRELEKSGGFRPEDVSPEKAVAGRAFPVLLICDRLDMRIPCRHAEMIQKAARGPAELWEVPNAYHVGALGTAPEEFKRRVLAFFERIHSGPVAARSTRLQRATGRVGPAAIVGPDGYPLIVFATCSRVIRSSSRPAFP